MVRTLVFVLEKCCCGLKTYLQPDFWEKTLSCGVSAFPDRHKSTYPTRFFLIYTEDSIEDTL